MALTLRGTGYSNASNSAVHLAAEGSPEILAKEQNISCNVSGPVKAICFPLPWVRGQITECTHTTYHTSRVPVLYASSYSTCVHSSSSVSLLIFLDYLFFFHPIFLPFFPFPHVALNSGGALVPLASLRDLHRLFILGCVPL